MPVIFISYRRSDSQDVTGRIYDRLVTKFTKNEVFRDIDNIPLGIAFPTHLKRVLGKSGVVLVIIGRDWLSATDERGRRRLDDPSDYVRIEIETALSAKLPVIPVLVSNASMPQAHELPGSLRSLLTRHGTSVRPDPDFNNDMDRLFAGIHELKSLVAQARDTRPSKTELFGQTPPLEVPLPPTKGRDPSRALKKSGPTPVARSADVRPGSKSKIASYAAVVAVTVLLTLFAVFWISHPRVEPVEPDISPKNDTKTIDPAPADKAMADYDKAIQLDSANPAVYRSRGDAYSEKRDYDKAIADYDKAIQLDPNYTFAYRSRGDAYSEKRDYDKAIADYDKAIQLDPNYTFAYRSRGNAYFGKRDYDKAIAEYDKEIQLGPDASSYRCRGNAYYEKRDYDKAIADYGKAIQLDPESALAYHSRGWAYDDKKDYDKAIADYSKAIELDTKNAPVYIWRGNLWRAKKDYEKAIADYSAAIELDPNNAKAFLERAKAYRLAGQQGAAMSDETKAKSLPVR